MTEVVKFLYATFASACGLLEMMCKLTHVNSS